MTSPIVDGLRESRNARRSDDDGNGGQQPDVDSEPSLEAPAVGSPISHGQVINLWEAMRKRNSNCSLEQLLRGSQVYRPRPDPKPEPSDEYKALMARLRREEAQRDYDRIVNPPPKIETFSDRFPTTAQGFSQVNRPVHAADLGDDDVSLRDVHRQVLLIINFLVSILGVAGTLWATSRWWSLPARIFLTMGGSILVAIAEVAVYSGYMWRMDQAKQKQKAAKEIKEVLHSWVIGRDEKEPDEATLLQSEGGDAQKSLRRRKPAIFR